MNEQTGAAVKTGAVVALVQCAAAAVLFVKRPDSLDAYSVLFLTLFLICWGMLTWASFTGGSMKTAAAAAVLVELGGALFALRGRDYAVKQAVILAASALAGCAAAFACSRLWRTVRERPVRTLLVCAGAAAGVFLLLLAFGSTVGGTRAWLRLGPLSVQLTELLKLVTLVAFSVLFGAVPVPPLRRYLLAAAFLALDAVILVCLSELGTLLLLVLLFLLMTAVFLPARCSLFNLAGIGGAAAVGIPAVALLSRMDAGSGERSSGSSSPLPRRSPAASAYTCTPPGISPAAAISSTRRVRRWPSAAFSGPINASRSRWRIPISHSSPWWSTSARWWASPPSWRILPS